MTYSKKTIINYMLLLCYISLYLYLKYLVTRVKVTAFVLAICQYEIWICGLLALLLTISSCLRQKWLKMPFWAVGFLGTFLYLVDIATQYLLQNRVQWHLIWETGGEIASFGGFIFYYFQHLPGLLSLLLLAIMGGMLLLNWHKPQEEYRRYFCGAAMVVMLAGLVIWDRFPIDKPRRVFNVYQVNSTSDRISYKNFRLPANWTPYYEERGAAHEPKNIILIVVESLSSRYSYLTSTLDNMLPLTDLYGQKGAIFTNYFSNGYDSADSHFAIITGHPRINGLLPFSEEKFYKRSFVSYLKSKGYWTFALSASRDIQGFGQIYKRAGFDLLSNSDDPAYKGLKRYVFDSVADEVLYDNLLNIIKKQSSTHPYIGVVTTASSHSPYEDPITGEHSLKKCITYADQQIAKLMAALAKEDFFTNGVVVITGDHHAMEPVSPVEMARFNDGSAKQRVPLIIYGAGIEGGVRLSYFDHASLGSMLEQLAVGTYEVNQFQQDINDADSDRLLLCQPNATMDLVEVYTAAGGHLQIKLNGDKTKFVDRPDLDSKYREYLLYLAWLRQNF